MREVIANEVKSQAANGLTAIPGMMGKDVDLLFRAANLNAQLGMGTVMYNTSEHAMLVQFRSTGLERIIYNRVDKYFEAKKAATTTGKILLGHDELLAPIASFVQKKVVDSIADRSMVEVLDPRPCQPVQK